MNCSVCNTRRESRLCVSCATNQLQHKRTALAALQADVAVLRRQCRNLIQSKQSHIEQEETWRKHVHNLETSNNALLRARDNLCSERLVLAEQRNLFEGRLDRIDKYKEQLDLLRHQLADLHHPVVDGLHLHTARLEHSMTKLRRQRVEQIFQLFSIQSHKTLRTITGLPLPKSGIYTNVPIEVVAAALGRIIHFLLILAKYLKLEYPHPMTYNSSFSTIGNVSEGVNCHTLYPDGTLGFERGLRMLQANVLSLCLSHGMEEAELEAPHDILGNLLRLRECSRLGEAITTSVTVETTPTEELTGNPRILTDERYIKSTVH